MTQSRFSFTAEVCEHDGQGAWHFVSLPENEAVRLAERLTVGGAAAIDLLVLE